MLVKVQYYKIDEVICYFLKFTISTIVLTNYNEIHFFLLFAFALPP